MITVARPYLIVATDDANNPVVVEGAARLITSPHELNLMLELENSTLTSWHFQAPDS